MSGTLSPDGLTGSIVIFDTDTNEKTFEYSFGPYSGEYDLEVVATSWDGDSKSAEVIIRMSSDGTSGEWSYTDYTDSSNDGSGSWMDGTAA